MAEGPAGIATATAEGIQEIVDRYPECRQVDGAYIETWFNDLCWGPDKITAGGRAHPPDAQRQPHDRDLGRTGARSTTSTRRPATASSTRSPTSR
jgi:hypothetical protein